MVQSKGTPTFKKRLVLGSIAMIGAVIRVFSRARGGLRPDSVRKILLLELWGVGDVVLSTPALVSLREIFPKASITVLAKPYAADILKNSPCVDEIIPFNFPWTRLHGKYDLRKWEFGRLFRLVADLRRRRFDLALDVRGDARSNLLMLLSGASSRLGYGAFTGDWMLTHEVARDLEARHRVDEWRAVIRYIDPKAQFRPPTLWVKQDEADAALLRSKACLKGGRILLGIHPGASNRFKKWAPDRFERLAGYLASTYGAQIVFFADPDGYGEDLKADGAKTVSGWPLRDVIALISSLDVFICNDGGPMHIAAALGVPTVAVFGPTLSSWFGPYGDAHRVVEKDVCRHKPCWDYCRFDSPECLDAVAFEDVAQTVDGILKSLKKYHDTPSQKY